MQKEDKEYWKWLYLKFWYFVHHKTLASNLIFQHIALKYYLSWLLSVLVTLSFFVPKSVLILLERLGTSHRNWHSKQRVWKADVVRLFTLRNWELWVWVFLGIGNGIRPNKKVSVINFSGILEALENSIWVCRLCLEEKQGHMSYMT